MLFESPPDFGHGGADRLAQCMRIETVSTDDSASSSAQTSAPLATADRLDTAIRHVMTDKSIPGAIVGIWSPDGVYVRPFGVADTASDAPVQTDFHVRIGSLTKTFTVTAVLQLVDQGKLRLDDPIAKYVPGRRCHHLVPSGSDAERVGHLRRRGGIRRHIHR